MYFESDCVECFVHLPWLCFAHYHKLSNSIYKVNVDTHGHLSQLRFQGMMTKILRNWKFSLSESFSGWYYGLRVFLTWFSSSETWKSLRSHSSWICSGPLCPAREGWPSPKAVPRGPVPRWGLWDSSALCAQHHVPISPTSLGSLLLLPYDSSNRRVQLRANFSCECLAVEVDFRRKKTLYFLLTSAHCWGWGKASSDTTSNAGSLNNHLYPED